MCGSMQHGANVPILKFTVLEGLCIACGCARCIIFRSLDRGHQCPIPIMEEGCQYLYYVCRRRLACPTSQYGYWLLSPTLVSPAGAVHPWRRRLVLAFCWGDSPEENSYGALWCTITPCGRGRRFWSWISVMIATFLLELHSIEGASRWLSSACWL